MKYASASFTLEQPHELKVCGTGKFTGTTLEVLLDERSVFVENNCKRYHIFEIPVEETTLTLYVKMSPAGEPMIALFRDGANMVDGSSYDDFLAGAKAECKREGKIQILRNLILQLILFGAVAFFAKWIGAGFKTDAETLEACGAWGLMVGGILTLLFMIFDLVEAKGNLKSLTKVGAKPTPLSTELEDEITEEIDESVDPDDIVVPDDAPNFFEQLHAEEEAKEEAAKEEPKSEEEKPEQSE